MPPSNSRRWCRSVGETPDEIPKLLPVKKPRQPRAKNRRGRKAIKLHKYHRTTRDSRSATGVTIYLPVGFREAAQRAIDYGNSGLSFTRWVSESIWLRFLEEDREDLRPIVVSWREENRNPCGNSERKVRWDCREIRATLRVEDGTIYVTAPDGWRWDRDDGPRTLVSHCWENMLGQMMRSRLKREPKKEIKVSEKD